MPGRYRAARLLLVGAALATGACGIDFDPPSKLDSLRILAVRAEPPEARPGEPVALDALVWAPGAAPQIAYAWRACLLGSIGAFALGGIGVGGPGVEDRPTSCFDLEVREGLAALAEGGSLDLGDAPTATLPGVPLPAFPALPSYCTGLPEETRVEQGGRELWLSGIRMTVSLEATLGRERVVANKRVVLRPDAGAIPPAEQGTPFRTPRLCQPDGEAERLCARNDNPDPPALTTPNGEWSGDGPLVVAPGRQVKLRPVALAPPDQQAFVSMPLCGEQAADPALAASGGEYERLESRWWDWYATGGEVVVAATRSDEDPTVTETAWKAPAGADAAEDHDLWVVARDGRGGVSWSRTVLRVDPEAPATP